MWMSDRPRTQQQLARDLATLVDVLPVEAALLFLDAFWKTMAREWIGIDVLR
jgi:ribosomal RNA-processing protein 1